MVDGNTRARLRLQSISGSLLALLVLLAATDPATASDQSPSAGESRRVAKTLILPIAGICSAGLADIREGLNAVPGILKIEGATTGDAVQVTYESKKVSPDRISKMIADLGYPAGPARSP